MIRASRNSADPAAVLSKLKDLLGEIFTAPPPAAAADLDTLPKAVEARLGGDKIPRVLTWVDT